MKSHGVENIVFYLIAVFLLGLQFFLVGSLLTFSPTDSSWFYHATQLQAYKNLFGLFGSYAASWCIYVCGKAAFFLPFVNLYVLIIYYFAGVVRRKMNGIDLLLLYLAF